MKKTKKRKWQVGDNFKVYGRLEANLEGNLEGLIGVITGINKPGDYVVSFNNGTGSQSWLDEGDMKFLEPKEIKYLLRYELDADPLEVYTTLAEIKERIKELAKRSDLKRDSIVVYELKNIFPVTLETEIKIKGI